MLQNATQLLIPRVVERLLNIEYANYQVFGKTAEDDAIVRSSLQQEHGAFVHETADAVDTAAKSWRFAPALTAVECGTLKRINQFLNKLLDDKPVHMAQLRQVLTVEQLAALDASMREPIAMAEVMYGSGFPEELTRYNIKVRDADFVHHKFEKMSALKSMRLANYKHDTVSRTLHQAEELYELALEYLEEQVTAAIRNNRQYELLHWLDRDVVFGIDGNVGANADQIPRVKGSRSHYATPDAALPKLSVRLKQQQRRLEALLIAAVAIAYVPEVMNAAEQQRVDLNAKAITAKMTALKASLATINSERD